MIVIALAALAYTWFSGIFASLTSTAGSAVTSTTTAMATQFRIEAARYGGSVATGVNATIRNTGTQSFNVSKSVAYVGGAYSPILGFSPPGTLAAGGTAVIYNIANQTIACPTTGSTTLTITIETGLTDSRAITC
jgi:archaellum component FlaF (FlaF/FlaG flagellin family)